MIKSFRKVFTKEFTLLLVVIAIIGILAALLFPAIQKALIKAKAVKVASNGKQIFMAVFDYNVVRRPLAVPPMWPDSDSMTNIHSSTEYFAMLVEKGILKGVDFSFFAAPGTEVCATTNASEFLAVGNAWSVTDGIQDNWPATVPFMFTKNVLLGGSPYGDISEEPTLDPDARPFGDKFAVVITKAGSARVIPGSHFNRMTFNPTETAAAVFTPDTTPGM